MSGQPPIYTKPLPEIADHPLFSPTGSAGIISPDAPLVQPTLPGGADALRAALKQHRLEWEETTGSYGAPERSFIVHRPTRQHMYDLGKALGQESVVFTNNGQHELLYTNGPDDGKLRPSHPFYNFHPSEHFGDYYTHLPNRGYFRLYFDSDRLLPAPLQVKKSDLPLIGARRHRIDVVPSDLFDADLEPLEKRSKNVREQTRKLDPVADKDKIEARRVKYAESLGLKPQRTEITSFPEAKRNRLPYNNNFDVGHETAHAMMTPPKSTIRQYQEVLTAGNDPEDVNAHIEATHDESVANSIENLIDRRAGLSPQHHASRFRDVKLPFNGDSIDGYYTEEEDGWIDEKATDAAHRRGTLPRSRSIPGKTIRSAAQQHVRDFDLGAHFNHLGRVVKPVTLDTAINDRRPAQVTRRHIDLDIAKHPNIYGKGSDNHPRIQWLKQLIARRSKNG